MPAIFVHACEGFSRAIRQIVPSMFHRRLWLLLGLALAVVLVLGAQLTRLTTTQAKVWQQKAQGVLTQRRLIPTVRGRVLDNQMRILALDEPTFDITVNYPVITGDWAYEQAQRSAYRANKQHWEELRDDDRDQLITEYKHGYDQQVEDMWAQLARIGGIERSKLDRQRATIIRRVKQTASSVWIRRLRRRAAELDEPVSLTDVAQPISEQLAPHAILTHIDQATSIQVQQLIAKAAHQPGGGVWQRVHIEPSRHRRYPFDTMTVLVDRSTLPRPLRQESPVQVTVHGVGGHIIGALRGIWKQDTDSRPYRRTDSQGQSVIDLGGYLPGDRVGRWGIEKSQEHWLRGQRGQVVKHLDLDVHDRIEPTAGQDVALSIDIRLQAQVQAIMDPAIGLMKVQPWHRSKPSLHPLHPQAGQALNGAAVVLDIASGQVLAAVTMPGFGLEQLRDDPQSVWGNEIDQPYLNRPVARLYQPGSIVKPFVLAAAVTDHQLQPTETITCNGHLDPDNPNRYRCWIYKGYNRTHGPLAGPEAIARSCNIFFYTLGRQFGAYRLVQWYDRLGLSRTFGCGLDEEVAGQIPDLSQADHTPTRGFRGLNESDAIFMAIGQGPIRWTALQAANCYATLARGGVIINPTFVVGEQRSARPTTDLHLSPVGLEMVMSGLKLAVDQRYGTANHLPGPGHELIFNVPGLRVYAKSGTAQGVPLRIDSDSDGKITSRDDIVRQGDHAWVVCLAGRAGSIHPDFVVVVVVEFGGSGATVAGPVVNQILHAMRARGYL